MQFFLELISENIWLLFIIIGIIVSMFGEDSTKKHKGQQQKTNQQKGQLPRETEQQGPVRRQVMEHKNETKVDVAESVEEIRQKQLGKFARQVKPSTSTTHAKMDPYENVDLKRVKQQKRSNDKKAVKPITEKRLEQMLSRKEIVESFILKEILDEPRSKQPYPFRRHL